jgi:hypothetical protein
VNKKARAIMAERRRVAREAEAAERQKAFEKRRAAEAADPHAVTVTAPPRMSPTTLRFLLSAMALAGAGGGR